MDTNSVGNRILQIRESEKLKQEEFAESLGLTKSAISGYETGRRIPSNAILKSIAKTYAYNENWLIYGHGEPKTFEIYEGLHAVYAHFQCTEYERAFLGKYFGMSQKDRNLFCYYMNYLFGDTPHEISPENDLIQNIMAELSMEPTSPIEDENLDKGIPASSHEYPTNSDDGDEEDYANFAREQRLLEKERTAQASSVKKSGAG